MITVFTLRYSRLTTVNSLRLLYVRLFKLDEYFLIFAGDDPDDISSSGTEDNVVVHSCDVEFKGTYL